jgi:GTP-binding protein Era
MTDKTYCGFVAIIGRPNVGKSTLLNFMLGEKISITSRKPQTTRQRIIGVYTDGDHQILFADTPGLHQDSKKALNKQLNRTASSVIKDVDVIVFMVAGQKWLDDDEWILKKIKDANLPVILVINKMDLIKNRDDLLPLIDKLKVKHDFLEVIPMCAEKGKNVNILLEKVRGLLPESPFLFPIEMLTDQSERQWVAEIIREKLFRQLGQEIPYAIAVEVETWKKEEGILRIAAVIWIERETQKSIVIGKGGAVLKKVGQQAREDMEVYLGEKVFLQLWVKVKTSWSEDERVMKRLGYWFDET